MLQKREATDEARAARMDEQLGRDAGVGIAEVLGDGGPTGHAIHIGRPQGQAQFLVLAGDGIAAAFGAEGIGASDKSGQHPPLLELAPESIALTAGIGEAGQEVNAEVVLGTKDLVPGEHGLDGLGMAGGNPKALDVLIQDIDGAGRIAAAKEDDGGMGVTVIHGREPFGPGRRPEICFEDMEAGREIPEILAVGKVPEPLIPSVVLPAGEAGEVGLVTRVDEGVVVHAGGDEAGVGLEAGLVRDDEFIEIPRVADAAGIGGGINPRTPVRLAGAAAGGDVLVFAEAELGGFLEADDVVFEAEVIIDILFALVMAEGDAGAVGEGEDAARGVELVGQPGEEALAHGFEIFEVGFADLAEEEAVEIGAALAIIGPHLGEEPVGFAAAASTAVADGPRSIGLVAEPGGGTGGELTRLQDETDVGQVEELITRTAVLQAELKKGFQLGFRRGRERLGILRNRLHKLMV